MFRFSIPTASGGGDGKYGKHICTSHSIKEEKLIQLILGDIKSFCRKLEAEKQKLIARSSRFIDMLADNAITESEYNVKMHETRSNIESIEIGINQLTLLVDKIEVTEKGEPVICYKFAPAFDAVI